MMPEKRSNAAIVHTIISDACEAGDGDGQVVDSPTSTQEVLPLSTWNQAQSTILSEAPQFRQQYDKFARNGESLPFFASHRRTGNAGETITKSSDLDFLLTIEHWGDQIFAYFRHRYTGGFVEAANGIGRVIDRQGRGYSFDVLRARLLYGQRMRQRKERTRKRAIPDDLQEAVNVDEHLPDVAPSTLT